MNEIDLRKIDLNLLIVFETVMRLRSVSRTAQELSRTQSAISHALERLRQQLNDPLLVRQGSQMVPSPFAQSLMQEIRPLLRHLGQALAPRGEFEPSQSERRFRLGMRDFLAGLFPDLVHLVGQTAPSVRLDWLTATQNVFNDLIDGHLDLFLGPHPMPAPTGIRVETVGSLPWACFARQKHPAVAQWSAATWVSWPHVQVGTDDPLRNPVGQASEQHGLTRRIGFSVPLFSAVAPILVNTDALATLPRAVMRDAVRQWDLVELPLPFPVPPIEHALYSAKRMDGDAGLSWFRQQVLLALAPFVET